MVAVNIPADALFLAVLNHAEGDFSKQSCESIISDYIGRFLESEPDVILLNVCYRRSLTPSEVFDSYLYDVETDGFGNVLKGANGESVKRLSPTSDSVSKYFASFFTCARELLKNGIDIYKFAIERIRKTDCRVFLSVRMNDGHYTANPAVNSSFARRNGGEHTINHDGVSLDFSQSAVQNYFYSYIDELLGNYRVDGIELDWLRYPTVLPPDKRSDYRILNGYMKRIRRLVDSYGDSLALAVRVLPTEADNLGHGVDVCEWIADGVVDIVTIENFYVPTNFELPVAKWRESVEKRNTNRHPYRLLCGSDWAVSCVQQYSVAMTPALVRGFTDACLESGADGVYLFNFFEENDTSSFEFVKVGAGVGRLENCFAERLLAAKNWQSLPRRYVHIGESNDRYPIVLGGGESYAFKKRVNGKLESCKCIIGCDKDLPISVFANGELITDVERELVCVGFEYISNVDERENEFIYTPTQAAPHVFCARLPDSALKTGALEIKIQNTLCERVGILWLEILCE